VDIAPALASLAARDGLRDPDAPARPQRAAGSPCRPRSHLPL